MPRVPRSKVLAAMVAHHLVSTAVHLLASMVALPLVSKVVTLPSRVAMVVLSKAVTVALNKVVTVALSREAIRHNRVATVRLLLPDTEDTVME